MAEATQRALWLRTLSLSDFRNYAHAKLTLAPGPAVLVGDNGAGKTNLLEAVSLLGPGRGLRAAPFGELAREAGAGGWAVSAEISGPEGEVQIGTGLKPVSEGEARPRAREIRVDGAPGSSSGKLGRWVRLLWLTPSMDRLFTGPASDRRRFFDRLVLAIDPEHGSRSGVYDKAMRERNRLLGEGRSDPDWLDALELRMAETGIAIAAARVQAITVLGDLIKQGGAVDENLFPQAHITIQGALEDRLQAASAVEIEDDFRKILYDSRLRDQAAGRSLHGPHRSDFLVTHAGKKTEARLCSTGEQKALLVSIILAQTGLVQKLFDGFAPLLLLDEIAAHLDAARRKSLFAHLAHRQLQVWMTGTDLSLFDAIKADAQIFQIKEGAVTAA